MLYFLSLIKKIKSSEFLRDVNILVIGTIISQGVAILAIPILSRIFNPNDYGLLALFSSVLAITANIVTLSYPIRIILPKTDFESQQVVLISIFFSVGIGFCLLLLSYLLPSKFINSFGLGTLGKWLSLAIFFGIILSFINTLNYWFNRNSLYKKIALLQILQSIILTSFSLIMAFLSIENGLILSQIFTFSILLIIFTLFSGLKFNSYHFVGLIKIIKKHKNAPKYLYPGNLLDVITLQLPFLLITLWFSQEMTGYYRMAFSCLNLPAAFFGAAIAQIFYKKFSQIWPDAAAAKILLKKTWLLLFVIGFPIFLIIAFAGETVFSFGLGSSWKTAGSVASILTFMCFFSLIHSPTSTTILAMGNEYLLLIFSGVAFVYRTLSLYIGYLQNDLLLGLKIFVALEIAQIIIYQYVVMKKINMQIILNKQRANNLN